MRRTRRPGARATRDGVNARGRGRRQLRDHAPDSGVESRRRRRRRSSRVGDVAAADRAERVSARRVRTSASRAFDARPPAGGHPADDRHRKRAADSASSASDADRVDRHQPRPAGSRRPGAQIERGDRARQRASPRERRRLECELTRRRALPGRLRGRRRSAPPNRATPTVSAPGSNVAS